MQSRAYMRFKRVEITLRDRALIIETIEKWSAVADPGFPVGGAVDLIGGVESRGGYVSKILYVEMKESGPWGVGGRGCAPGTPIIC